MDISDTAGLSAIKNALKYIDSVPIETPLPAMPGFEREWLEDAMRGEPCEQSPVTVFEGIEMCLEWIDALPKHVVDSLEPFDRTSVEHELGRLKPRARTAKP